MTKVDLKTSIQKFVNLFLRGSTILLRFSFVLFLSKEFDEKILGEYTIFNTTIILGYLIVGFEFYTFSNRDIISSNFDNVFNKIINQFILHISIYVAIFVIVSIYLAFNNSTSQFGFLDATLLLLIPFLIIPEHFGQEFYRLNVALGKQIRANTFLFIRGAGWICISFLIYFTIHDLILKDIIIIWILFSWMSLIIEFIKFKGENQKRKFKLDLRWIWHGVKISKYFFVTTIIYKLIEFGGRYILDFYHNKSDLGIFSFFSTISNIMNVLIYTLVIMYHYPNLVSELFYDP